MLHDIIPLVPDFSNEYDRIPASAMFHEQMKRFNII